MHVCDTTYIPSIHLYAYIYIYIYIHRLIAFIPIHRASWGQEHIQRSATNASYTDISLCTGIHKSRSVFPQKAYRFMLLAPITTKWEGKASDNIHLPAMFTRTCRRMRKETQWGMDILRGKGEYKNFKGWFVTALKKKIKTLQLKCLCNIGSSVHLNRFLKPPGSASLEVKLYEQITARFYFSPAWML